jgi:hypothetical protein
MLTSDNRGEHPIRLAAIFAVVLALGLGGCTPRPNPWSATARGPFVHNPERATVVLGQTFIGTLLANESCPTAMTATWSLAGGTGLAFQMRELQCVGADQPPSTDFSRLPAKYLILQLLPGNYRLDEIRQFRRMRGELVTPIRDTRPTPRGWPDMTVPRFSVAAGEVVHVGTLVYLRAEPVNLRTTSNLAQARDALREIWPEGAERLIERRMLVGAAQP